VVRRRSPAAAAPVEPPFTEAAVAAEDGEVEAGEASRINPRNTKKSSKHESPDAKKKKNTTKRKESSGSSSKHRDDKSPKEEEPEICAGHQRAALSNLKDVVDKRQSHQ
jgi:hypothetical protein